jgi:hypothetical protein
MSSLFRTALVGVGVIAVCFAMATLKGHHLLLVFAGASLACGIWSWKRGHRPVRKTAAPVAPIYMKATGPRDNVCLFPAARSLHMSDASGS